MQQAEVITECWACIQAAKTKGRCARLWQGVWGLHSPGVASWLHVAMCSSLKGLWRRWQNLCGIQHGIPWAVGRMLVFNRASPLQAGSGTKDSMCNLGSSSSIPEDVWGQSPLSWLYFCRWKPQWHFNSWPCLMGNVPALG